MNNQNPFQAAKSKIESAKSGANAKNERGGHAAHHCEAFNAEYADYDCDYVDEYTDELQVYLDYYADYYGCELELCGLTAGAEQPSTTAAPLLLALLFWLFK